MNRGLVLAAIVILAGCSAPQQSPQPSSASPSATTDLDVYVQDGTSPPACTPDPQHGCPTYSWPPPQPSRGAWVMVEDGNLSVAARTDDEGHARFASLPNGVVNVTVVWRSRGDHTETQEVLLSGGHAEAGFRYQPPSSGQADGHHPAPG